MHPLFLSQQSKRDLDLDLDLKLMELQFKMWGE